MDAPDSEREPIIKANGLALKLTTVIQIGLLLVAIVGGYFTLKAQFTDLSEHVAKIDSDIDVLQHDLADSSAREQEKFNAVRDALNQLRDKWGLSPIVPGNAAPKE